MRNVYRSKLVNLGVAGFVVAAIGILPSLEAMAASAKCRASLVRIGINEPVVANPSENPCVAQSSPGTTGSAISQENPNLNAVIEIGTGYARTRSVGRPSGRGGNDAEAGATDVTIAQRGIDVGGGISGPGYIYIDSVVSSVSVTCGTTPGLTGRSYVAGLRNAGYLGPLEIEVPEPSVTETPPNHRHVVLPGATLHLNEQILFDTNGDSVKDKIVQRALYLDFDDPTRDDAVLAESSAGC